MARMSSSLFSLSVPLILLLSVAGQSASDRPDDRVRLHETITQPGQTGVVDLRSDGALVVSTSGRAGHVELTIPRSAFPRESQVVAARLTSYFRGKSLALAVVVNVGGAYSYRVLHNAAHAMEGVHAGWYVSDPIFENSGAPFRIVEILNIGGDSIEITFRRDTAAPATRGKRRVEVKIYRDGDDALPTYCGTGLEDYVGTAWGMGQPLLADDLRSARRREGGRLFMALLQRI